MAAQLFPKTIQRNENDIILSWSNDSTECKVYCLQMLDDFKEWKTVYRGNETIFTVKNLAPSEVYTFRIKFENSSDHELSENWCIFKSSTSDGPFYETRHLMKAMHSQQFGLIRKIVKSRPELLEIENKKGNTPLIQAIERNDMKMINLLLHLGADINRPLMYSNKTPLMFAVSYGFFELVKFLVNKGASINNVDINGLSILHNAIDSGNYEIVEYFIGLGLNVNTTDRHNMTPLIRAIILEVDQRIIQCLLDNGADQSIRDRNGFDFNDHKDIIEKKNNRNTPVPKFIFVF